MFSHSPRPLKSPRSSIGGFTLIELLMVIAVVLILAGITFGISRGVQNAQARAKAKAELAMIAQSLEQFKARYGDYPWIAETSTTANANTLLKALTGWMELERDSSSGNVSLQPLSPPAESLLDDAKLTLSGDMPDTTAPGASIYLIDPWGNPYVYIYNKTNTGSTWDNFGYLLMSSGSDGVVDFSGADTDGLIDQTWRELPNNIDNIYVGE